jgi:hypothetical protein
MGLRRTPAALVLGAVVIAGTAATASTQRLVAFTPADTPRGIDLAFSGV